MNNKLGLLISTVFHPVFLNLFGFLILFRVFPSLQGFQFRNQLFLAGFVFFSTALIPMITILLLKLTGKINSIQMHTKEERKIPYLITAIGYMFCYYILREARISQLILSYLNACSVIVILVFIINHYWKISIHLTSFGSLLAIFLFSTIFFKNDLRLEIALVFLVSGFVASTRIFLQSHNFSQVISGYALGFTIMFIMLLRF